MKLSGTDLNFKADSPIEGSISFGSGNPEMPCPPFSHLMSFSYEMSTYFLLQPLKVSSFHQVSQTTFSIVAAVGIAEGVTGIITIVVAGV